MTGCLVKYRVITGIVLNVVGIMLKPIGLLVRRIIMQNIEELKLELNKLIADNGDYESILKVSQELDELIVEEMKWRLIHNG
jgi:hypothetical protein